VSDKFKKGSCFYNNKFQCDGEPNGVGFGDVCDAVCIGILVVSHEGEGSEHLKRRLQYTDLYIDVSQKTKIFSANELTALSSYEHKYVQLGSCVLDFDRNTMLCNIGMLISCYC
jgi:hypothetical protein